jgi:hypothetical protein
VWVCRDIVPVIFYEEDTTKNSKEKDGRQLLRQTNEMEKSHREKGNIIIISAFYGYVLSFIRLKKRENHINPNNQSLSQLFILIH